MLLGSESEPHQATAPRSPRLRVLIAEDHQLVLEGIRKIIESECQIVGTTGNGRDLLSLVDELKPDLLLLDIALPLLNGIEAARQLHRTHPGLKIIFVTMQLSRDYVRAAFEAGASGYVLKQAAAADLVNALREVKGGRYFVSSAISDKYLPHAPSPNQNPSKLFGSLTPRQREVLQLVAEGKSAKEIGNLLFISVKTVEFHKKHLMEELDLRSTAELIRYAVEHGWVSS
ncbi:MAG: response regulator transcription factor [Acidobacteriaceae bacterium]|nr:response regulator transcription factor [Acidobacteriaceae bacterium]MBV9502629.1 response regulator transcription factor [Acidobacteriaceae bacterium]